MGTRILTCWAFEANLPSVLESYKNLRECVDGRKSRGIKRPRESNLCLHGRPEITMIGWVFPCFLWRTFSRVNCSLNRLIRCKPLIITRRDLSVLFVVNIFITGERIDCSFRVSVEHYSPAEKLIITS